MRKVPRVKARGTVRKDLRERMLGEKTKWRDQGGGKNRWRERNCGGKRAES
jgi:hypothetical protein